ncbi:MAG: two-component sensor histidine kinase [Sphingomonas bacterium]|uniref:ATP-binding protein n=1 Tax=Sphingomonas bacterium TaxID=1895847 RepID=UPI002626C12D|nr:ATP-binding protein [Sphingomonas bacterium]MDB5695474.1 two-component sensor histidine kinase [Sphingomonas bacterium]
MRPDPRWPAALLAAAGTAAGIVALGLLARRPAPAAASPAPRPGSPALADVLDAVAEPVLLVDGFVVTLANRAATTVMGAQIVGQDVRDAIPHPDAAERLSDLDVGDRAPIELKGLGPLNQRWEMRVAAIGEGRRLVHLMDHTESHAAERMRTDFVANASHELRTPLAAVRGFIETLEEAGDDVEVRTRFLSIMGAEALRMQRLVEDLISLSRIEAEKFRLPSDAVDLAGLAKEVHAELVAAGGGRGGDVILALDPALPRVIGDRAQLSQVLHNLVSNAMKYGREGTPVKIALDGRGADVRLAISDQGEGIPAKHIPRLTQRFYRVNKGRSRSMGGTGLGLAIVKHIVERHRGRLQITSEVGIGTTVAVILQAVS